jgi:hypothetical protein
MSAGARARRRCRGSSICSNHGAGGVGPVRAGTRAGRAARDDRSRRPRVPRTLARVHHARRRHGGRRRLPRRPRALRGQRGGAGAARRRSRPPRRGRRGAGARGARRERAARRARPGRGRPAGAGVSAPRTGSGRCRPDRRSISRGSARRGGPGRGPAPGRAWRTDGGRFPGGLCRWAARRHGMEGPRSGLHARHPYRPPGRHDARPLSGRPDDASRSLAVAMAPGLDGTLRVAPAADAGPVRLREGDRRHRRGGPGTGRCRGAARTSEAAIDGRRGPLVRLGTSARRADGRRPLAPCLTTAAVRAARAEIRPAAPAA